jgi:hypothetical protein
MSDDEVDAALALDGMDGASSDSDDIDEDDGDGMDHDDYSEASSEDTVDTDDEHVRHSKPLFLHTAGFAWQQYPSVCQDNLSEKNGSISKTRGTIAETCCDPFRLRLSLRPS